MGNCRSRSRQALQADDELTRFEAQERIELKNSPKRFRQQNYTEVDATETETETYSGVEDCTILAISPIQNTSASTSETHCRPYHEKNMVQYAMARDMLSSPNPGPARIRRGRSVGNDTNRPSSPFSNASGREMVPVNSLSSNARNLNDAARPKSPLSCVSNASSRELVPVNTVSPITRNLNDATRPISPLSCISNASGRRQGRALQARLEKARYMQMALSKSVSGPIHGVGDSPSTFGGDESSVGQYSAASRGTGVSVGAGTVLPLVPYKYSLSHDKNNVFRSPKQQLNNVFVTEISSGTFWAELDKFDKILALAMSRNKFSMSMSTPPLFLAVGTEDGDVSVTELLDDDDRSGSPDPLRATTNPSTRDLQRRIGPALNIRRGGRIRSLDFSPDGVYLAVGGDDCTCAIFRLVYEQTTKNSDTKKLIQLEFCTEIQRVDRVYAVQFSPNSHYLAIGGFDGTVAIASVVDFDIIVEIPRDGLVYAVDWSSDGKFLAIGGSDKKCALVDVESSWRVFHEFKRSSPVHTVRWHPQGGGKCLAIGAHDIAIVNRESLTVVNEIDIKVKSSSGQLPNSDGNRGSVCRVHAVCWSPNGSHLVSCGPDNCCTILETKKFTTLHEVHRTDNITAVVWGQQSVVAGTPRKYLAIGGEDRKVVILKAGLETYQSDSSFDDDYSNSAASSYFSNRGEWILKDDTFRDMDDPADLIASSSSDENLHNDVICIAFSRGSKSRPSSFVAYATSDGMVTVRSLIEWKVVAELQFEKPIRKISFANGSRYLSLVSEDSKVYIVVTSPSWQVVMKKAYPNATLSAAYSKNNTRFAVGTADGLVTFFNPRASYGPAGEIANSNSPVLSMDWSSKYLAIGREDGTVSIFDSEQIYNNFFAPVVQIKRDDPVQSLAFGISSRFLAVADSDGFLSVYSAKGGWVLCHQVKAESSILSVRWSPTGRFLAFSGEDRLFRVIDTIFWAEVHVVQNLTAASKSDMTESHGPIEGLSFSQDGKLLAFGGSDLGMNVVDCSSWAVNFTSKVPAIENETDGSFSCLPQEEDIDPIPVGLLG